MQVGILARAYPGNSEKYGRQDYFFRECIQVTRPYDIDVFIFSPDGVETDRPMINGFFLKNGNWLAGKFSYPPIIYDRSFFYDMSERVAARLVLKKLAHLQFINSPAIINLASDKWLAYQFMIQNGIPTPFCTVPRNIEEIMDFIDQQRRAFVKPRWGFKGMGILVVNKIRGNLYQIEYNDSIMQITAAALAAKIKEIGQFRALGLRDYLLQEYVIVPDYRERTFDIRILAQKNKKMQWQVTGMAVRLSPAHSAISNLRPGSEVDTVENLIARMHLDSEQFILELHRLTRVLCNCLEQSVGSFGELAIDSVLSRTGQVLILEINTKPGRFVFSRLAESTHLSEFERNVYRQIRRQAVLNPFLYAQALAEKM